MNNNNFSDFSFCLNFLHFLCLDLLDTMLNFIAVFYNYAFSHTFAAVEKTNACRQPINERDAIQLPHDQIIRMGYFQNISSNLSDLNEVNLYAMTSRNPPFN